MGHRQLVEVKRTLQANVIDGAVVITGSLNFTKSAEDSNAENLLVIRSRAIAARYAENWQQHQKHAVPYSGR